MSSLTDRISGALVRIFTVILPTVFRLQTRTSLSPLLMSKAPTTFSLKILTRIVLPQQKEGNWGRKTCAPNAN